MKIRIHSQISWFSHKSSNKSNLHIHGKRGNKRRCLIFYRIIMLKVVKRVNYRLRVDHQSGRQHGLHLNLHQSYFQLRDNNKPDNIYENIYFYDPLDGHGNNFLIGCPKTVIGQVGRKYA